MISNITGVTQSEDLEGSRIGISTQPCLSTVFGYERTLAAHIYKPAGCPKEET